MTIHKNTMTIHAILLAMLFITGAATESFAWSKVFQGSRDQVRAACTGGRTMVEAGDATYCQDKKNGTGVSCDNGGHCEGYGPGPAPRNFTSAAMSTVGGVLGVVRTSVDLTQFGFDTDGNSSGKQPDKEIIETTGAEPVDDGPVASGGSATL